MKFLILVSLLSFSAMADDKVLLSCSTPGGALAELQLIESKSGPKIAIDYSESDEDEVVSYKIRSSLKNIAKGDSDTLVGLGTETNSYGGAASDAVLLRVLPGQKKAFLAARGLVFDLNCY